MKSLIYAVDDELSIRELYACALESAGFEAVCFEDGDSVLSALKDKLPDLILLDVMLEKMDGFDILKAIRNDIRTKRIPVIMVSAKGEEISKVKGLNLGADDYIAKPFGVMELIARINANLRKHDATPKQIAFKDIVVDDASHEIRLNGNTLTMTLKEYELLSLLVQNAQNVVNRNVIFATVWGEDFMGETRTLDNHIASLRKLIVNSTACIETIRGVGYLIK